jgi:hypothetical protein
MKISVVFLSVFLLSGCASGLYIKASPENSREALLKVSSQCRAPVTDEERALLSGKLSPNDGKAFTKENFENQELPNSEEKKVLEKIYMAEFQCRSKYVEWIREYAPQSYPVVNTWYEVNVEIARQLSQGTVAYGQALVAISTNLNQLFNNLDALEFAVDDKRKNQNRALIEAYFGNLRGAKSQSSNSNLVQRCSSQGKTANFGTGGCF